MPALRVGLTGGIGSGKSEVARRLESYGARVIDADRLAREVVAPGTDGLAEIVKEFGSGVLGDDGSLDRERLGAIVFADDAARQRLNAIIHPRVAARAADLQDAAPYDAVVVYDVPLLVENDLAGDYDIVVVVDAPVERQLDRLTRLRGMSENDAQARVCAQADRGRRRAAADVVIDNTTSLEDLDDRVRRLWEQLMSR
ncbi:MAG: dephospho-CoA kinase [Streptosporangiaceae bacterium]